MNVNTNTRLAVLAGSLFAVVGALQATGLDWTENAVKTPLQHLTMALFAAALVVSVPVIRQLAAGNRAWIAIAVGQIGVAAASTVSNIRGVDASWFPAVAIAANALWIVGTLVLAFGLRRTPLLAVGLVLAYIGAIPLAIVGGGIVTGCFYLSIGLLKGNKTMKTVLLGIIAALAITANAGATTTKTLDLAVDGMHATRTLVDAAPKHTAKAPNDSPGDTIVLHAPLLNASGHRLGLIDATFLTTARGSEQLTGTLSLAGGQLAVLGSVAAEAKVTHVAVIGGTGRYAGARGTVTATFSPRAVKLHIVLN